jgi:PAS domain S-box-containing protein
MMQRHSSKELWADFKASLRCESDPQFKEEISLLNAAGMRLAGTVAIGTVLFMMLVNFMVFGKHFDFVGVPDQTGIMLVFDEAIFITLGLMVIAFSHTRWGRRHGRLIVALMLMAFAVLIYVNFLAKGVLKDRGDATPITFMMLVGIGTMPFRPAHTLALGASVVTLRAIILRFGPGWLDLPPYHPEPQMTAYLIMLVVVATGISTLIYAGRFRHFQDHARERKLRKQISASEQKYRAIYESSSDGIFVIDRGTGRFATVNHALEEMLAIPAAELYTMEFHEVIHPDDRERITGYYQARIKGDPAPMRYDLKLIRRGSEKPVICELTIHRTGDESVTMGAVRDMTEHVEADQKLRAYARELEDKNREIRETQAQLVQSEKMASLGNLVAGVAHEINTPLGSIHANADTSRRALDLLDAAADDPAAQEVYRRHPKLQRAVDILRENNTTTLTATDRIVEIVRSLRSFARLDEAEFKKVNIHEGIESTLTILHHEIKNRIDVHKEFGDLPEIECYPNQMNQVFLNLLVNAAQAIGDRGTITIRTRHQEGQAVLEFEDTGKGIPAGKLQQIFDPGFTTKGVGVGTGLGLSISYRIIQDHGGTIAVDSTPGRGTTFTIRLPVERA